MRLVPSLLAAAVALLAFARSPAGGAAGSTGFRPSGAGGTGDAGAAADAGGGLGAACAPGGCASGLACLIQIPGGYCSAACGANAACPSGGSCVEVLPGQEACGRACAQSADCPRPGDLCDPGCFVCVPPFAVGQVTCGATVAGEGGRLPDGGACGTLPPDGGSAAPPLSFGASQLASASAQSLGEAQPSLAADDAGTVVVAYMDNGVDGGSAFEGNEIGLSISRDDGASFVVGPPLVFARGALAFDPSIGYSSGPFDGGGFFLAVATYEAISPPTGHAELRRSADGVAWSAPLDVEGSSAAGPSGGLVDRTVLAVNPVTAAPWVAFMAAEGEFGGPGPYRIELAVGDPSGQSFGAPLEIDDGTRPLFRDLPVLAFDGLGDGEIAWLEAGDGASVVEDQNTGTAIGGSAANAIWFARLPLPLSTKNGPANVAVSAPGEVVAAVTPGVAVSPDGASIYVTYAVGTANATDVVVAASHDWGQSFGPSVKVNDDPTCATHFQALPWVDARDRLFVLWVDDRDGAGNVFAAVSRDGGKSFSPSQLVSDGESFFTTLRNVPGWLGDQVALGPSPGTGGLFAAWTDDRGGTSPYGSSHVRVARAPLPP